MANPNHIYPEPWAGHCEEDPYMHGAHQQAAAMPYGGPSFNVQRSHIGVHLDNPSGAVGPSLPPPFATTLEEETLALLGLPSVAAAATVPQHRVPLTQDRQVVDAASHNAPPDSGYGNYGAQMHTPQLAAGTYGTPMPCEYNDQMPGGGAATYRNTIDGTTYSNATAGFSPQAHAPQGAYGNFTSQPAYASPYNASYFTGLDASSLNYGQGFSGISNQHLFLGSGVGPYIPPIYPPPSTPSQAYSVIGSSLQAPVSNATVVLGQPSIWSVPTSTGYEARYGSGQGHGHSSQPQPRPQSVAATEALPPGAVFSYKNVVQSEDLRREPSSSGQSIASIDPSETGSAISYLTSASKYSAPPRRHPPTSHRMVRFGSMQLPRDSRAEQRHPAGSSQSYASAPTSSASLGPYTSPAPSYRGGRTGPLPEETKQNVVERRVSKSVCIWCKLSGIACIKLQTGLGCQGCKDSKEDQHKVATCIPFYFMHLVEAGSTLFTARRYTGPRDGGTPQTLILKHIRELARTRNIRAVADNGTHLYDLDLDSDRSNEFLSAMCAVLSSPHTVQAAINARAQAHDWRQCVIVGGSESNPGVATPPQDALRMLELFDDAVSGSVTYKLVYRYNGAEEDLRPDTSTNRLTLLVANLASVILGRQIEHAAFYSLHKRLPKHHLLSGDDLDQLAGRLFALRWHVSLCRRRWKALSAGPPREEDPELGELARCMARDRDVAQKLYFCFCFIHHKRQKPQPRVSRETSRQGRTHRYAGTRHAVTERCPDVFTCEGFEQWMLDGEELVRQADLVESII